MVRQQQEAQLRQQQAQEAAKQKALQEQQQAQQQAQMRQQQEAQMRQQQQLQQQQAQQQAGPSDGSTKSTGSGNSGLDIISGLNGMSLGVPNSGGSSGASVSGSVGSGNHRRGGSGENLLAGGNNSAAFNLLQESFATLPSTNEHDRSSSRNSTYAPQNPYPSTPASFPSVPNPIFENPAIFEKLGTDALFYIFYYKQGTYQQYLAARELKKQSWRFHKKYMTWFQRHEEPKVTTDDYEQGTYVYFDWETGWCTRIKQDFTFEYVHLEDTLQ